MITIGTDTEVFGMSNDTHKALCGLIGGTKDNPAQVQGLPYGFSVQEDNVSLEFNIPPAHTREEFIGYVRAMRDICKYKLNSLSLQLSEKSSFSFSKEELTHPQANVFGCEPDYNAWTLQENPKPTTDNPSLRTCGGHVHVGTDEIDMITGTKNMDLFLGVPSIIIDSSPESMERRKLYGKAGAMRPKPYGWEYRVLSNFWMFSDTLVEWVYSNTLLSCRFGKEIDDGLANDIQICINTSDKQLATKLISDFKIPLPKKKPKDRKKFKTNSIYSDNHTLEQFFEE